MDPSTQLDMAVPAPSRPNGLTQWPQRPASQPVPPEATTKATGVGVRIRTIRTNKNTGETFSSAPRLSRTNGNSARPVLAVRIRIGRVENPIGPRIEGRAH